MTQAANFGVPTTGPATPDVMFGRTNDNFVAALTGHSGSSRPPYAQAGTVWQDTSTAGLTRFYFYDGSDDILLCEVDETTNRVERAPQPLVDIASTSSMDLGAVKSENLRVTGTTGPTSFGTARAGTLRRLYFAGDLTITRNATSLETPTGQNLAVKAGDEVVAVSLGSGNWRILSRVVAKPRFATALLQDQKSSGTGGGTNVSGSWATRVINTEVSDPDNIVDLSSNQFTPTIDCVCSVVVAFANTAPTRIRIYSVTDATEVARSPSVNNNAANNVGAQVSLAEVPLSANKSYRVEYFANAVNANGLGAAVSDGGTEVYLSLSLKGLIS